ncbi:MAG: manganese efflux pump MntP family protein [Candidatus Metalachnospira sp.]|nr:manganese efflux pump MntP family protein [Candidatus Metalachnospira sp.]
MNNAELFILALGLSMDAFAVSICKGLTVKKAEIYHYALTGAYFGGFQALMPLIGYMLGLRFQSIITNVDHWIAFILLSIIGINMIMAAKNNEEEEIDSSFAFRAMIPLAVATSIDALAVGITFAFLSVNIVPAVSLIGITTFILSAAGIKIGSAFGTKYKSKAELFGGIVLILMGIKILLEHLGILGYY